MSNRPSPKTADQPLWFLHGIDPIVGKAKEVETTRARLAQATFLDGRERYWDGSRIVDVIATGQATRANPFVFHQGFCGSTLLSRLLAQSGALVLREPHALVDIAAARPRLLDGGGTASLDSMIDYALDRLGAIAPPDGEGLLIKPTSWANVLLQDLCVRGRIDRALFLTMDRRAFLVAGFRGGRDRLEYCLRLAGPMAAVLPRANDHLRDAIGRSEDPLDRAAHIVALLWLMQVRLFDSVIAANDWPDSARLDFADLLTDPEGATIRAAEWLGLDTAGLVPGFARAVTDRHSKTPEAGFDAAGRDEADAEVEHHHAARFDAALAWLDRLNWRGD